MGEVEPEGIVAGEAIATEDDVEDAEFLGNSGSPAEEDVRDDKKFMFMVLDEDEDVWDEGFEGWCWLR